MLIDLSRVGVSGPLAVFAVGFADHMTREGYNPRNGHAGNVRHALRRGLPR
jgi:hypothetical protein